MNTTIRVRGMLPGVHDETIHDLFMRFGEIMDITISDTGNLVTFENSQSADNAVERMDNYQLGDNILSVTREDITTLYVYNIPPNTPPSNIQIIFGQFDGIRNIQIFNDHISLDVNENLAGNLIHTFNSRNNFQITRNPPLRSENNDTIYIYNLASNINVDHLHDEFIQFGEITAVGLYEDHAEIGFVDYQNADIAIAMRNGREWHGSIIRVTRDHPLQESPMLDLIQISENIAESKRRTMPQIENNLIKESYEIYMRQLYNLPVVMPEFLILNGLKVNFIPFSEINTIDIHNYILEPMLQVWAGLPSSPNRIITIFGKNGMTYLVKAKYDQVNDNIFPPV